MIGKSFLYFGQPIAAICDAQCHKAWGISQRPRINFDPNDPDDNALLADDELGDAPVDPGTYEGGYGKPQHPDERMNKWCVRECERCTWIEAKETREIVLRDFSARRYNQPWKHEPHAAQRGRGRGKDADTPTE